MRWTAIQTMGKCIPDKNQKEHDQEAWLVYPWDEKDTTLVGMEQKDEVRK